MTPIGSPPGRHLPQVSPSTLVLTTGTRLWRLHSTSRSAISFKDRPADDVFGGGRFDGTAADPYPYLYAAPDPATAILETLTRGLPFNPKRFRTIPRASVINKTMSAVVVVQPLTLISLVSGADLAAALQDEWLIQCEPPDYPRTRRWASWLREQEPAAHGIAWLSRRNVGSRTFVLFGDRCPDGLALESESAIDLASANGADWLNLHMKPYRTRIVRPAHKCAPD